MPIVFSKIATAWNQAKYGLTYHQGLVYGNAKDKGSTRIYIEFTYKGEDFHLTMTLARGGDCSAFHLTPESATNLIGSPSGKKAAGGTVSIKSNPSVYYDFSIRDDPASGYAVTYEKAGLLDLAGQDKPQKVYSGVVDAKLEKLVKQFMTEFITDMVYNGDGTPD